MLKHMLGYVVVSTMSKLTYSFRLLRRIRNLASQTPRFLCRSDSKHTKWSQLQLEHLFSRSKSNSRSLICASALFTVYAACQNFEPDDPKLKSPECLKNAAGLSVDSSSAVLSQTVYAIQRIEKEYTDLMNLMIKLVYTQIKVLGDKADEEQLADIVLETRTELDAVKQRKQDLELLFASVEKLADATAEVCFATGMDYASTSTGERLYSAQQEVSRIKAKTPETEERLALAQVKLIEALGQLEDKEKREKEEEEEIDRRIEEAEEARLAKLAEDEKRREEEAKPNIEELEFVFDFKEEKQDKRRHSEFDNDTNNEKGGGKNYSEFDTDSKDEKGGSEKYSEFDTEDSGDK